MVLVWCFIYFLEAVSVFNDDCIQYMSGVCVGPTAEKLYLSDHETLQPFGHPSHLQQAYTNYRQYKTYTTTHCNRLYTRHKHTALARRNTNTTPAHSLTTTRITNQTKVTALHTPTSSTYKTDNTQTQTTNCIQQQQLLPTSTTEKLTNYYTLQLQQ